MKPRGRRWSQEAESARPSVENVLYCYSVRCKNKLHIPVQREDVTYKQAPRGRSKQRSSDWSVQWAGEGLGKHYIGPAYRNVPGKVQIIKGGDRQGLIVSPFFHRGHPPPQKVTTSLKMMDAKHHGNTSRTDQATPPSDWRKGHMPIPPPMTPPP